MDIIVLEATQPRQGITVYTLGDEDGQHIGYARIQPVGPPQFGQSNREYWYPRSGQHVTNDVIKEWDAVIAAYETAKEAGHAGNAS